MARLQHILQYGVVPFFILWKIFDHVLAYLAPNFIPFQGNFSHPSTLDAYLTTPRWITAFAQFDGIFYLRIASNGYAQFEQAFFPLYPLLIRTLSIFFMQNQLAASLAISNISFVLGLLIFEKYLRNTLPKNRRSAIRFIIIFLLLFPTSFFFGATYTEGLFFLLVVLTFFLLDKKNYALAAIVAYFAASTRLVGVFLFIPFALTQTKFRRYKMIALAPFLGLATYMYYLYQTTRDPVAFFSVQPAFGAGRSTHLILLPQVLYRYLKMLLMTRWSIGYFVSLLELMVFVFVFVILSIQLREILRSKQRNLLGLNLFSLTNLLVPTLTGTLSSVPRYALLSVSFFVYVGLLKSGHIKLVLCFIFTLLHVALVTLFIQGYFVS